MGLRHVEGMKGLQQAWRRPLMIDVPLEVEVEQLPTSASEPMTLKLSESLVSVASTGYSLAVEKVEDHVHVPSKMKYMIETSANESSFTHLEFPPGLGPPQVPTMQTISLLSPTESLLHSPIGSELSPCATSEQDLNDVIDTDEDAERVFRHHSASASQVH